MPAALLRSGQGPDQQVGPAPHLCFTDGQLKAALDALQASDPSTALDALELAGRANNGAGAAARWARRAILRSLTDVGIARVIAALQWALEHDDRAA